MLLNNRLIFTGILFATALTAVSGDTSSSSSSSSSSTLSTRGQRSRAASLTASTAKHQQCNDKAINKYDADIARLMSLGQFGRPFPEDFKQIDAYCAETTRLNEKIDSHKSRCTTGSRAEFSAVILYSIKRTIRSLCRKNRSKRQTAMLRSLSCANRVSNRTAVCYDRFIDQLQGIPKAPFKRQIPHACCEYIKLLHCFEEAFNANAICRTQADAFLDFVRSIFDDIVNLTCADFNESSDRCDKLAAPPAKDRAMKRTKSFIVPLMKVWESADIRDTGNPNNNNNNINNNHKNNK